MFFLDLSDTSVQVADAHSSHIAATVKKNISLDKRYFGFCMIADVDGSLTGGVDITRPFYDSIPKHIQKALDDSAKLGVSVLEPSDEAWLAKWQESFDITVLRQPGHGKVRRHGHSQFIGFMPDNGYLGKDQMNILIEGKTPDGRSISAQANIFIRVDSKKNLQGLLDNHSKMTTYIKRNCPESTEFWEIDNKALDGEKTTDNISVQSSLANQDFSGFWVALAKNTGTGSSAKILLNINAADFDWYIDYTPYLNKKLQHSRIFQSALLPTQA